MPHMSAGRLTERSFTANAVTMRGPAGCTCGPPWSANVRQSRKVWPRSRTVQAARCRGIGRSRRAWSRPAPPRRSTDGGLGDAHRRQLQHRVRVCLAAAAVRLQGQRRRQAGTYPLPGIGRRQPSRSHRTTARPSAGRRPIPLDAVIVFGGSVCERLPVHQRVGRHRSSSHRRRTASSRTSATSGSATTASSVSL